MSASVVRAPAPPGPPHDPTSLLLDGVAGWRAEAPEGKLEGVEVELEGCALVLSPLPAAARRLDEDSGSLGGIRPPGNVAVWPEGEVLLLDRATSTLKRFDPCCCRFEPVTCIGTEYRREAAPPGSCHEDGPEPVRGGGGARQWRNPGGIAIHCGDLYVCDTGLEEADDEDCAPVGGAAAARVREENHRVSVFAVRGWALRGHLRPPAEERPWRPAAIAFDSLARAWVADALGWLHRFTPQGSWERKFPVLAGAKHLAIDARDRVWVVAPGADPSLAVFAADGSPLPLSSPWPRPAELGTLFPGLPFDVDAAGDLDLAGLCAADAGAAGAGGLFDLSGLPLDRPRRPAGPTLEPSGTYRSRPLDSKIAGCTWHRVILHGEVPPGASVVVRTATAEQPFRAAELETLASWQTSAVAGPFTGEWDCLVRSGAGRHLHLELELRGEGNVTPRLSAVEVEFPRVSLRRFLPAVFGEEPASADFTDRFLALFDTTLRRIEGVIDTQARLFDPASTPAATDPRTGTSFLSWLASWVGIGFGRGWDEATRRRFLGRAGALFDRRGTLAGLREQLLIVLGLDRLRPCPGGERGGDRCALRCVPAPRNCRPAPEPAAWPAPPLVLEHFRLRRWLRLGAGALGEQAVLWSERIAGRSRLDGGAEVGASSLVLTPEPTLDPFLHDAHRFSVFVPARCGTGQRRALEDLVRSESPAHTAHTVHYVEPRFRIGIQSMIGFDAVVAAVPPGMTLGETALCDESMLGGSPRLLPAPSAIVAGKSGRIGTTAALS